MISFDEARREILRHAPRLDAEQLKASKALGRYLAADVPAPCALPRFEQSAMDGFGVRVEDVANAAPDAPAVLRVIGELKAGDGHKLVIGPGEAARTMTGARIAAGVEAIAVREVCEERDGFVFVKQPVASGAAIRRKGEELVKGAVALKAGARVTPPVIGLLATLGVAQVKVGRAPAVTIISTGNELRPPGEPLKAGQIYDSNSCQLRAALRELGVDAIKVRRVKDKPELLRKTFAAALDKSDVLIAIGGVSVGDYDFVKDVLAELNVQTIFWGVAIKPGRPNFFGLHQPQGAKKKTAPRLVFGLPGNPVSALVSYHQLIKPALVKMLGGPEEPPELFRALLTEELSKPAGRLEFVRAKLEYKDGLASVTPVKEQGSHMTSGLAHADCLIHFDSNETRRETGATVRAEKINWNQ